MRFLLPGELAMHAVHKGAMAVMKYTSGKLKPIYKLKFNLQILYNVYYIISPALSAFYFILSLLFLISQKSVCTNKKLTNSV